MMVKGQFKTYTTMLIGIKSNIDVDSFGVEINKIRKSGKEYIMLQVERQRREVSDIKIHSKEILLKVNDIDSTMNTS